MKDDIMHSRSGDYIWHLTPYLCHLTHKSASLFNNFIYFLAPFCRPNHITLPRCHLATLRRFQNLEIALKPFSTSPSFDASSSPFHSPFMPPRHLLTHLVALYRLCPLTPLCCPLNNASALYFNASSLPFKPFPLPFSTSGGLLATHHECPLTPLHCHLTPPCRF